MAAIRRKPKPNLGPDTVSKLTVINRLEVAGKLDEALVLLDLDPKIMAKWNAIQLLQCGDANAIALITELELDPAVILAKE